MSDTQRTTTIEVKTETWAALDKRKGRGDSFDDVIQKLINQTPAKFGELQEVDQPLEYGDVEPLPEDSDVDRGCAHYDIVTGVQCENEITVQQNYRFEGADEWDTFYYCDEHAPEQRG